MSRWRLQRQPVADVLLGAPDLLAPFHRLPASRSKLHEVVPSLRGAEAVNDPQQIVGVGRLDGLEGSGADQGRSPVATGRSRRDQSEKEPT